MKMKRFLATALFAAMSAAHAGQFDSIIDALSIPSSAPQTNNSWDSLAKVKGVRWAWPLNEAGAHDFSMAGSAKVGASKNPNIGATRVIVYGARDMIFMTTITVANESAEIKDLGKGNAIKIQTTCDDDSMSEQVAFYRFTRQGFKPLFVRRHASYGAGGAGSEELAIAYDVGDLLTTLRSNPCKQIAQSEDGHKAAAENENRRTATAVSGVSPEKAAQMAGEMYQAYRYGGVGEMLSLENSCWNALAKQQRPSDASATSCSVAALAGAFIEATYARKQMRGAVPAYNSESFRQRLIGNMAKAKINQDRAERILELTAAHQESVLAGLINAGMR